MPWGQIQLGYYAANREFASPLLFRRRNDSTYITLENELSNITTLRDNLASRMSQKLDGAEFHGQRISESEERELTSEAEGLFDVVRALAQ